jgi:hypothetical protein
LGHVLAKTSSAPLLQDAMNNAMIRLDKALGPHIRKPKAKPVTVSDKHLQATIEKPLLAPRLLE